MTPVQIKINGKVYSVGCQDIRLLSADGLVGLGMIVFAAAPLDKIGAAETQFTLYWNNHVVIGCRTIHLRPVDHEWILDFSFDHMKSNAEEE